MVSAYTDIIAMRHPKEGAPIVASSVSRVPIINAGDGGHYHPTQTLTDLLTIKRKCKRFDNLTVGICGDLKYGRTVHSLISALARYEGVKFVLISPDELRLPDYIKQSTLDKCGIDYREVHTLEKALPSLDILYMTRIQAERFSDKAEYERLKCCYELTEDKLGTAKADLVIMHPLPRVTEINVDVDEDERCAYFDQAAFGRYIRMALIIKLLSDKTKAQAMSPGVENENLVCKNPLCITGVERGIKHLFKNGKCAYCDQTASEK